MQYKKLRLEQAEHNLDACIKFDSLGGFADWAVTTAFYSSVHYVQYKLFPMADHNGSKMVMYQTFSDYNTAFNPHNVQSRHTVMLNLVKKHAKNIEPEYRMLYDNCLTARYSDYRVSTAVALLSKENLVAIKSYCNQTNEAENEKVTK